MAGQAGPVAAGALDTDDLHGPQEAAQPGQQAGVAGGGNLERFHAEQSADPVQGGSHMGVGVGVHAASDDANLYDGHGHLFHG